MVIKRSISIKGHKTSYSLEDAFYDELLEIARNEDIPLARLVARIDRERSPDINLSSALRLHVLKTLKNRLED